MGFFSKKTKEESIYSLFSKNKYKAVDYFSQVENILDELEFSTVKENLKVIKDKLERDTFKVLVVGSFSNGKSTFINSLLGESILPAYAIPTTAVINEIKYGEYPKALMHFRTGIDFSQDSFRAKLPEKVVEHLSHYSGESIPPIEIPFNELENYVIIPDSSEKTEKESILESPYSKVEIFYPLEILKDGVEIIDSPGINEDRTHTTIATDYVKNSDGIIYILSALATLNQEEKDFIENDLIGRNYKDTIFVVNRFDQLPDDKERERVKKFALEHLFDKTSFGHEGFFFTDAYHALEAKINKKHLEEVLEKTEIGKFEKFLANYLVYNRGKIKLSQPIEALQTIINDQIIEEQIPQSKQLLMLSVDEVTRKKETILPILSDLEIRRKGIIASLDSNIQQIKDTTQVKLENYYEALPGLLTNYLTEETEKGFETKISLLHPKKTAQQLAEEIVAKSSNFIRENINEWSTGNLYPVLQEQVQKMFDEVEVSVNNFCMDIGAIKVDLSNNTAQPKEVSLFQRAVGVAGGLLLGGPDAALWGGMTGFNPSVIKSALIQIGGILALDFFALLNPATFVMLVIGTSIFEALSSSGKITKDTVKTVSKKIGEEIENNKGSQIEEIITKLTDGLLNVRNAIDNNLSSQIFEIREQLDTVEKAIISGEKARKEKEQLLTEKTKELIEISNALQELQTKL